MRDNTDYMIGGAWARHPSDTMHMLVADTWAGDIPVDQLAKLTLHFVVQRGDTRKCTVDTCCLPRCHGGSNAQDMLEILADYLENVTAAAAGLPPQSLAFDGATLNSMMQPSLD